MATSTVKKPFSLSSFEVQKVDIASSLEVNGGANASPADVTATKAGYYPIGIVGYSSSSLAVAMTRLYLTSRSSGSCTVTFRGRNMSNTAITLSNSAYVLWVKES